MWEEKNWWVGSRGAFSPYAHRLEETKRTDQSTSPSDAQQPLSTGSATTTGGVQLQLFFMFYLLTLHGQLDKCAPVSLSAGVPHSVP